MDKDKQNVSEELMQIVVFKLGEEEFGVDILQAREIETLDMGVTRVPKAPSFVEGVINLRGEVIPIVDMRKRFSLTLPPLDYNSRIIIVEMGEGGNKVGLIVDTVVGVLRIPMSAIEPAPDIVKSIDQAFISGVARVHDRLIVLLNLERTLSTEEVRELSEVKLG